MKRRDTYVWMEDMRVYDEFEGFERVIRGESCCHEKYASCIWSVVLKWVN